MQCSAGKRESRVWTNIKESEPSAVITRKKFEFARVCHWCNFVNLSGAYRSVKPRIQSKAQQGEDERASHHEKRCVMR